MDRYSSWTGFPATRSGAFAKVIRKRAALRYDEQARFLDCLQTIVGVMPPSTRSAAPLVADESGLAT